jgi:hypothetical protein
MGGSYGGGLGHQDIQSLSEKVKQKLSDAKGDASRHVFISFDHEDLNEVNLLRGQAKSEKSNLQFDDYSVKEPFDSTNADYIKRQIREKIDRCSVTVVYLSDKTASSKWVNWEIAESIKRSKGVIGVYKGDKAPGSVPPAFQENGCKAVKWEHATLMNAIENASTHR